MHESTIFSMKLVAILDAQLLSFLARLVNHSILHLIASIINVARVDTYHKKVILFDLFFNTLHCEMFLLLNAY